MTWRTYPVILAGALALSGCLESTPTSSEPDVADTASGDECGDGEKVEVEGVTPCLYRGPITETGFQCPPQLPGMYAGDGFAFCAEGDGASEQAFDMAAWKAGLTKKQVDVLFVVDNSTSMIEEQVALVNHFDALMQQAHAAKLDLRVAVTTADVLCDPAVTSPSAQGVFNVTPAAGFPPSGYGKLSTLCSEDADCVAELGQNWSCLGSQMPICDENPNGSLNTSCVYRCDDDAECASRFGPGYYCNKPSSSPSDWGCLPDPGTSGCPAGLPAILQGADLAHFRCNATVGVIQHKCFKYEQGFEAARLALDVTGPNSQQAMDFLRPKAHLAIVFVTDEDDCSVAPGQQIHEDFYDTCAVGEAKRRLEAQGHTVELDHPALLAATLTTDDGGPLVPVAEYVDFFKSLKPDPSMVTVAAVTGHSDDPAELIAYVESKGDKRACYKQTSLCETSLGKTDWGSRYVQLVEAFGPRGVLASLCDASGIGSVMNQLGVLLAK